MLAVGIGTSRTILHLMVAVMLDLFPYAQNGDPQILLLVGTNGGDELWPEAAEVSGMGDRALATFFLPFTGGDAVGVDPSRSLGLVVGWEASTTATGP